MSKKYIITPNDNGYFTFDEPVMGKFKILYINGKLPDNINANTEIWDLFTHINSSQIKQIYINKGYYNGDDMIKILNLFASGNSIPLTWYWISNRFGVISSVDSNCIVVNKKSRKILGVNDFSIQYGGLLNLQYWDASPNLELAISISKTKFKFVKGLVGDDTISIITPNNEYVVHNGINNNISSKPFENNDEFKNRATWYEKAGLLDSKITSFESYDIPNYHIHIDANSLKLKNDNDANAQFRCAVYLNLNELLLFDENNFVNENDIKTIYMNAHSDTHSIYSNRHFSCSALIKLNNIQGRHFEYKYDNNYNQIIEFKHRVKKLELDYYTKNHKQYDLKNVEIILEKMK